MNGVDLFDHARRKMASTSETPSKSMGERIREIRGNLSQNEFARRLNVSQSSVGRYEHDSVPDANFLKAIYTEFEVNLNWLVSGEGPRFLNEKSNLGGREDGNAFDNDQFVSVPFIQAHLDPVQNEFIPAVKKRCYAFRKGWLSEILTDPQKAVLLECSGKSMETTIYEGDIVMIDTGKKQILDGCIYGIEIGNAIVIKELQLLANDRVRIISKKNEEFPPYETRIEDIRVLGQIVWSSRQFVR